MGLFGGSKSSSASNTSNYTTTTSQSSGDLAHGNVQAAGDVDIVGFYGDDLTNVLGFLEKSQATAISATTQNIADSNRRIQQAFTDAYTGSGGTLREFKPVLMLGIGLLAIIVAPKILKGL